MTTLRITIIASAKAAGDIMQYMDVNLDAHDASVVGVEIVDPGQVRRGTPRALASGRHAAVFGVAEARSAEAHRQAPGTPTNREVLNPYVVQAVQSSGGHVSVAAPAVPSGRNRVIYMLVNPAPEAVVVGIPRQVLDLLSVYPDGMSAKEVEEISRLRRKSVESALYNLRTQGMIESIAVETT